MTREKLTAGIVADCVELSDADLEVVRSVVAEMLAAAKHGRRERSIEPAALAARQRAREAGTVEALGPADLGGLKRGRILVEIAAERSRQVAKWGDGMPGGGFGDTGRIADRIVRDDLQQRCSEAQADGRETLRDVLTEEVSEVLAERPGSAKQRAELVQVAAVCVKWIEGIDAAAVRVGGDDPRCVCREPGASPGPCVWCASTTREVKP